MDDDVKAVEVIKGSIDILARFAPYLDSLIAYRQFFFNLLIYLMLDIGKYDMTIKKSDLDSLGNHKLHWKKNEEDDSVRISIVFPGQE